MRRSPSIRRRGTARWPSAPSRSAGARPAGSAYGSPGRWRASPRQAARQRHHQVAAGDERLLVGRRDDLAGPQRGEDRPEADDAAGRRRRRGRRRRGWPAARARRLRRRAPCRRQVQPASAVSSPSATAAGRSRAACSARSAAFEPAASATTRKASGCAARTSTVWRPIDPVEPRSATPMRPLPHAASADEATTYRVTTGAAKRNESTRSSMPPWPGMRVPESLAPAARLSTDSARSPAWAARPTSGPRTQAHGPGVWPRPPAAARPRRSSATTARRRRPRRLGRRDVGQELASGRTVLPTR